MVAEWKSVPWDTLGTPKEIGRHRFRIRVQGGADKAVEIPVCSGRKRISLDGRPLASSSPGPVVVPLPEDENERVRSHDVVVEVTVGPYEKRIACAQAPKVGSQRQTTEGLTELRFSSPVERMGGGQAVVFIPSGLPMRQKSPLLVGLHPWDGSPWTYASYSELLREAQKLGVVLLFPSGLGNSLYTADAEKEVLRALAALESTVMIDRRRISLWGASMGGAGATTIGFHHPSRFASVTSFFGDSKYDLETYVRAILRTESAAHLVNALDVLENARHLPVYLVHGDQDRVSPLAQSEMLDEALKGRGFSVQFERVAGMGHEGALLAPRLAALVERASKATLPTSPARVTYRSVRPDLKEAYGVELDRLGAGDAVVDVEGRDGTLVVHEARGLRGLKVRADALGGACARGANTRFDPGVKPIPVECLPASDGPLLDMLRP
jgi:enterochelin esterase-like enzyme